MSIKDALAAHARLASLPRRVYEAKPPAQGKASGATQQRPREGSINGVVLATAEAQTGLFTIPEIVALTQLPHAQVSNAVTNLCAIGFLRRTNPHATGANGIYEVIK